MSLDFSIFETVGVIVEYIGTMLTFLTTMVTVVFDLFFVFFTNMPAFISSGFIMVFGLGITILFIKLVR